MARKYILGNWKMNGTHAESVSLAGKVVGCPIPADTIVAVFPPFTMLDPVHKVVLGTMVALGAQDCSAEPNGAFTGDISAGLLKDIGCGYVILGHSERRALHGESDEAVKAKAEAALKAGLIPVICVGESLEERESGEYLKVVTSQVERSVPKTGRYLIAYEPVWAIGSGKTPTLPQISEVHKTIASVLSYGTSGAHTPITYGGSVKAANAREILACEGVDGVLVGGASLKADEFGAIIAAAR